ncbi:hypothetical protein HYT84_04050, partial [Candidatus Micrarchaeota archaeon]|nr:hypothetical protein [Candidatus Micrarchaeota archaeon]
LHKPLRLHKRAESLYEINGTPADCVLFAIHSGEFKKPDLVFSGINFGDNSSLEAIIGSGTIGACWEAALQGVQSIAFSLFRPRDQWKDKHIWGNREMIEKRIIEVINLLKDRHRQDLVYSVNIPPDPANSKIVFCNKLQKKRFKAVVEKRTDPSNVPYYWLSGDFGIVENGTDLHELVKNNNITIATVSFENLSVKD